MQQGNGRDLSEWSCGADQDSPSDEHPKAVGKGIDEGADNEDEGAYGQTDLAAPGIGDPRRDVRRNDGWQEERG